MLIVKSSITVLIVVIAVLSVYGYLWWGAPPEKLADYATGGRVILAILVASCFLGLLRLWAPARSAEHR